MRVTSNAGVRSYTSRAGAPGKVMNVDLQDEQGTEMRCTLWHEMAEKHALIVGKTYYIGRGQLKVANRQYMQVDNQYEMTLNNSCVPVCPSHPVRSRVPLPPCAFLFVLVAHCIE